VDKAPHLARTFQRNHVFVVALDPNRADFVAVDPKGEEFDRFSIPVRP
jgi:hypothetical protein